MEVAVAGVEDVGDAQARFLAEPGDFAHDLREGGARNHTVENVIAGRKTAECAEGVLAAFPKEFALGVVTRQANFAGVQNGCILSTAWRRWKMH